MNQLQLFNLAGSILAVCCIIFGWLTAKKGFQSMRDGDIDGVLKDFAAEHYGGEAAALGMFVFCFGFGLIYLMFGT